MFDTPGWRPGQKVMNQDWPRDPLAAHLRRREETHAVMARIVLEDDGDTWLQGQAVRWDANHVWVEVDDPRLEALGVWLRPTDVYRSEP